MIHVPQETLCHSHTLRTYSHILAARIPNITNSIWVVSVYFPNSVSYGVFSPE